MLIGWRENTRQPEHLCLRLNHFINVIPLIPSAYYPEIAMPLTLALSQKEREPNVPKFYYGTPPLHHPCRRSLLHLNTAMYQLPGPKGERTARATILLRHSASASTLLQLTSAPEHGKVPTPSSKRREDRTCQNSITALRLCITPVAAHFCT